MRWSHGSDYGPSHYNNETTCHANLFSWSLSCNFWTSDVSLLVHNHNFRTRFSHHMLSSHLGMQFRFLDLLGFLYMSYLDPGWNDQV